MRDSTDGKLDEATLDHFLEHSLQNVIDENPSVTIIPQNQYIVGDDADNQEDTYYRLKFDQVYLSYPTMRESDGTAEPMYPNEARLRNLTYAAPLYCDIQFVKFEVEHDDEIKRQRREEDPEADVDNEVEGTRQTIDQEFLGDVPIMLRSSRCQLSGAGQGQLSDK